MDDKQLQDEKAIEKRHQTTLKEIQKELETYAKLGVDALNDAQKAFIRARRDYLSDSQAKLFTDVLTEEDVQTEASLPELKERGAKVGLEYKPGTRKADFLAAIEQAESEVKN